MRVFAGIGEVETRYEVAESDARLALNIFIRFEGVNGTTNGFSRLLLRGRRLGVVGSVGLSAGSAAACTSLVFHAMRLGAS